MTWNDWLSQAQPKIHFSPKQLFVPNALLHKTNQPLPEYPDCQVVGFDDVTAKINRHYTLPFQPYDYQARAVNALAEQKAVGLWLEVGGGKTLVGTMLALAHRIDHAGTIIVVMPPILLRQWQRFFQAIPEIGSVLLYRGTPQQRKQMDLDVDVLLLSIDIFKNDFMRLYEFYYARNVSLIVDEAVSVKNPDTMNHKCVWAFQNQDLSKYQRSLKTKADNALRQTRGGTSQADKITQAAAVAAAKQKINDLFR